MSGDKVEWRASQGVVRGTIKKKLTSPTDIKGHHVAASEENPEYTSPHPQEGLNAEGIGFERAQITSIGPGRPVCGD